MTELEHLILDGILRNEPFICCHDGYAYFLGPEAPDRLNWKDAMDWCKSLGDGYELPTKEVLNECYKNESIRKEFKGGWWYWSSTVHEKYKNGAWFQYFTNGNQNYSSQAYTYYVRSVRRVAI